MKTKTVIIAGPTASGKSSLALDIAERFNGQIISADSMQIYKRLDIGTAKPSLSEQSRVKHRLIDIAEPWQNYSVADFITACRQAVSDTVSEGCLPVICGGTGLYIEALLHPTDYASETDPDGDLRGRLMSEDAHTLWLKLYEIDPEAAAAVHENNKKRVVRALEIYYKTGKTKTETDKIQKRYEPEYDILLLLCGFYDRETLYRRINVRVDGMIADGLADETKLLLENGDLRPGTTAYQAIGYKELFPYINGEASLAECSDKLKQATRNYAKRQLTWFGRYDGLRVLSTSDAETAVRNFIEGS